MFAFGLFDKPTTGLPAEAATTATDQNDALQIAGEGTVLLKNSGNVLPLGSQETSIAVIGADASSTGAEWARLLDDRGFTLDRVVPGPAAFSIVEATRSVA